MDKNQHMDSYPLMTAHEYKRALKHYNMPNTQFCKLIGVGWRQGIRYKNDQSEIPEPVARFIRTIVRHRIKPEKIG